ncbi:MAG TPA: hypothetical protein DEB10_15355 [Ruminococcaceae bacterium]|nr:hypothetical protein [Clostridiales bacterium]HBT66028.1 hypothetical protein [Oscillospiraceae bacterium]
MYPCSLQFQENIDAVIKYENFPIITESNSDTKIFVSGLLLSFFAYLIFSDKNIITSRMGYLNVTATKS